MEMLKKQLHFLSKKFLDKHNKLCYTHGNSMYYTKPTKTKVCFLKKEALFILYEEYMREEGLFGTCLVQIRE